VDHRKSPGASKGETVQKVLRMGSPSAIAATREQQQSSVSILSRDVTHTGVSTRAIDETFDGMCHR
jgi:hypothetical protein